MPRSATSPVLRSRTVRGGRLALLLAASLLVLPVSFGAISLLYSPSEGAQLAVVGGVMLAFAALLVVGILRWALRDTRVQVTPAGVREEADVPGGPRVREVAWGEMRDYVLSDPPNGARTLTIRPRAGRGVTVAQGPTDEDRAAFDAFHAAFLAGVGRHRPAEGAEAIRARPSFFDGRVARVLAGCTVVMLAGLAVLVLTSDRPVGPADWLRLAMIAGLLLPLVVRVFAGTGRRRTGMGDGTSNGR